MCMQQYNTVFVNKIIQQYYNTACLNLRHIQFLKYDNDVDSRPLVTQQLVCFCNTLFLFVCLIAFHCTVAKDQ